MKAVIGAVREVYGLFVEDGAFAVAILLWLIFFAVIVEYVSMPLRGPVLFLGFATILIIEVRRASTR